ncbi:GtrA family protein [Pontibacter harenae]|uniref:GtrA family protein n=1 Tax=Pontibacter harenae TaxID=2894083 RepID=UPI001E495F03|nr:GtrA family protein [Pontibacter harenae]MCC9168729.1 GtrA family protein [Pontibacter harenae]
MKYTSLVKGKQKELVQIVRFGIVGFLSAIFDMFLFITLHDYFGVNYLVANFGSTSLAIVVNYYVSKKWVFSSGKYSPRTEFITFMVFSGIGVVLNHFLIMLFVEHFLLEPSKSKLIAIALVAVFNFVTKKLFVFKS